MIYYVEDDRNIRDLTVYALQQSGIEAEGLEDAAAFSKALKRRMPDAVLLDIMLPGTDGLELLHWIRSHRSTEAIPVMMITARDTELDVVDALDSGADDYLAKPFGMLELVSRCRALLRRAGRLPKSGKRRDVEAAGLVLSPSARTVHLEGSAVDLTPREFDLLAHLLAHAGETCSRDELLRDVWGWDFNGGSRTVDVHVQTLRSKLAEWSGSIHTLRGVGYRLDLPGDGRALETAS